ncbi:MAG: hypothetical protein SWZ49_32035, partial [Cyanobacteriota bacterium]|nr:hypothetical protein [Cyanobacteriota bacterium]
MKFLGIDLGWQSQPSGLCCLELIDGKLLLQDLDRKDGDIGIISDPKFGIGIIPSYSSFKKIFEEGEGDDEELDLFAD